MTFQVLMMIAELRKKTEYKTDLYKKDKINLIINFVFLVLSLTNLNFL